MAVVTTKSSAITNRDATPPVKNGMQLGPRSVYEQVATVEVANGDSIGSKLVLMSLPSNARMSALWLLCDAITSGAADFGIYRTTQDGGAVVDADCFASAQSIASAITTGTNILHESGVLDISEIEQPLWQILGLTADPNVMYDLVATLTAAAAAAGTLTARVTYTQG